MTSLACAARLLASFRRTFRRRAPKPDVRRFRPGVDTLEARSLPSSVPLPTHVAHLTSAARNVAAPSNYVGFAFGPYVGQWVKNNAGQQPPPFNGYGSGNWSVQKQIDLVATRASAIATYSAGYAGYYSPTTPYNKVDSAWMVGSAAANLNKRQGKLALTVSHGAFQQVQSGSILNPLMTAEINGALAIAKNANAIFPRTVQRLVITNEYVANAATTTQVDQLVQKNKAAAQALGVKIGVRSNTFGQLTNSKSPYLQQLQQLVKDVDFIMLNLYPSSEAKGVAAGAADVAEQYKNIRAAALKVNPKVEVLIGETGWASQGISFNDLTGKFNTVANSRAYFSAIQSWANANKVETFYFEGIDEPWKSNLNQKGGNPWTGPNGAEAHYGLWTYNTSDANGQFVAKWTTRTAQRLLASKRA